VDLPLTGEVSATPEYAGYCHCTRCQRRTGGASSLSARLRRGSFTILEGAELIRTFAPDRGYETAFCSNCGSALFSRNPEDPEQIGVRMGTFDAPWEPIPDDGLPRYPESRPR
jgi:hypothetical protein